MSGFPILTAGSELGLVELGPGVLTQLTGGQLIPPTQNLPVVNTRIGNLFEDRFDANLRWYLPAIALVDGPDPGFAFDAVQAGVGAGTPFNQARLTIDLRPLDPADLAAARAANPAATFRPVPFSLAATLTLPYTADDGTPQTTTATGQILPQPDGTLRATFDLLGPAVIIAYQNLTDVGGATITLLLTYDAWQRIRRIIRRPIDLVDRLAVLDPSRPLDLRESAGAAHPSAIVRPRAALLRLRPVDGNGPGPNDSPAPHPQPDPTISGGTPTPTPTPGPVELLPIDAGPFMPPGGWDVEVVDYYVPTAGQDTQTVPLGLTYHTDAYRPRYTISAGGTKRAIIDVSDLAQFTTPRSEYRELTSLGDVQGRYPSFRRLYLGQVSGTVVAIPTSYGILRSSAGTAALCEAAVDPSPASVTGCRFQFTFTVAPEVDPIDLAQLALDLPNIPEAAGRSLQLALPSGLDPRTPATLEGFAAATAVFSDGVDPHTLLVNVTIADDRATPAITNVNLFLDQLMTRVSTPVFGTVAVRLDDLYPQPVQTTVLLNLRATADADDVAVTISDGAPPTAVVTNHAPFDLQLLRSAVLAQSVLAVSSLGGTILASGQTAILPGDVTGAVAVLVDRTLALPTPLPKAALFGYVRFHTQTVQQVQHPLTVDANAVNLASAGITQLDIHFAVTNLPALTVPAITLTPAHAVDFVHVLIPVDAVLTGLTTSVTILVSTASGQRQVTITHDFLEDPILTLTSAQLG
jgi:hypothetical protein